MNTLLPLVFILLALAVIVDTAPLSYSGVKIFRHIEPRDHMWSRRRPANNNRLEILKGDKWIDERGKVIASSGGRPRIRGCQLVMDNPQIDDVGTYFNNDKGEDVPVVRSDGSIAPGPGAFHIDIQ